MKDDKKKLAIIGVLGFIIVGVGAFQFMGGGGSTVKPKPAAKKDMASDAKSDAQVKNPEFAVALPARDPFKAPADSGDAEPQSKPPAVQAAKSVPPPSHLTGTLKGEVLPSAAGGAVGPLQVKPDEPKFGYRLSGLISGHHPAAVFTDSAGAQRLVPLSGSLDGDSQLLAVKRGFVVVSFRGKHLRLSLGGTPDAN